jgi:DNA-binding transcriptional LysR family regulator
VLIDFSYRFESTMNVRFLEAFLWIVRLESFRAAADHLHISQAAISSRIATLEDQLGRKLFDRKLRNLPLTEAGHALVPYAERMIALQEDMQAVVGSADSLVGSVRIGVVETVVHSMLVDFLSVLNEAHPAVALEITSEPTANLHEKLRRGALDVAIQNAPLNHYLITDELLCRLPMGWVRRKDTPETGIRADEELRTRPIITFPAGSQPHHDVVEAFKAIGQAPKILHHATSIAAIMRLVGAGLGIASMPLAAIREDLSSGMVVIVESEQALPSLPLFLSYRESYDRAIALVAAIVRQEVARFGATDGPTFVSIPADQKN